VQLLVADALVECSFTGSNQFDTYSTGTEDVFDAIETNGDFYLQTVVGMMTGASGGPTSPGGPVCPPAVQYQGEGGPLGHWYFQRNDPNCNVSDPNDASVKPSILLQPVGNQIPSIQQDLGAGVGPIPYPTQEVGCVTPGAYCNNIAIANQILKMPSLNLCLARALRTASPGTAGANDTLFMAASDQRELLEVIRERAQMAMIEFAQLALAFTSSTSSPVSEGAFTSNRDEALGPVMAWGNPSNWPQNDPNTATHQAQIQAMGADFAAAVQLHAIVSQEIAALLTRSSSAREPRGGQASNLAQETWGAGSWRQRTLASLYGGAALATESDGSSPWHGSENTFISHEVGVNDWAVFFPTLGTWPDRSQQPYFQTDLSRPEAQTLLGLARTYNTVFLQPGGAASGTTDCTAIDRTLSPRVLYTRTEAALESDECGPSSAPFFFCGLPTPSATCGHCVGMSCCAQMQACANDSACVQCLGGAPGAGCSNNQAFVAIASCYATLPAACLNACQAPACGNNSGTCNPLSPGSTCDPWGPTADYSGCRLYVEHGITPDHATIAANYLADLLEPICTTQGTQHFGSGSRDLASGTVSATAGYYQISSDAQFIERGDMEIQPIYGRYASFYMPLTMPAGILPYLSSGSQGFDSWGTANITTGGYATWESHRLAGSVAALAATREALLDAELAIGMNTPPKYLAHLGNMLGVINAAVGPDGVAVRPLLVPDSTGTQAAVVIGFGGVREWSVTVTRAASEPTLDQAPLYAIFDDPNAANLVMYPNATLFQRTYANVMSSAQSMGVLTKINGQTVSAGTVSRFRGTINLSNSQPHSVTLVAQVTQMPPQYVVLAANVPILAPQAAQNGFYFSQGGSLTKVGERLLNGQIMNPSKPAYDGFGLRTDWVPPTDPTLFGGMPGQDAAAYYLAQAEQAGQSATDAVQQAFTDLLQQASDTAAAAAAQQKSKLLIQQQSDALCGQGNMNCDKTINSQSILKSGNALTCDPTSTNAGVVIDCIAYGLLQSANGQFLIADEVFKAKDDPSPPAFSSYTGGSLQAMFVQQWGAIKAVNDAVAVVLAGKVAAKSNAEAADALLATQMGQATTDCSKDRMKSATLAGISVGASAGFPGGASASVTFNPGPLAAQVNKCQDETASLPSDKAAAVAAQNNAILAMVQQSNAVHDAVTTLAETSADISKAVADASRAQAQAAQDAALASSTVQSNYSVYRDYSSYDLWRAQAMVDNARRYAVAARRAIEAKFIVDLSTMTADEAFVAAPSTWADEVYGYDFSLPAAVGLSVGTGSASTSGIYPNKIADYIGNLKQFVNGYAVNRPTASASGESDVISLLGPDTSLAVQCPASMPGPSNTLQALWSYYCPGSSQWVQGSSTVPSAKACGGGGMAPSRARLVFSLDAWGRIDQYGVQAPPSQRFNTRWARLAVNLVGTGIKDCTLAADPLSCYSSSFIPYNLTHTGPSWVVDYENEWRTLGVPIGQINLGKALTAEQWLDPVSNGWDKPYVQAVQRLEFSERPLDGSYQLELELGPEVVLGNIERVQILADTSYWVRQQ
jgi:hypothetical protein